MYRVKVGQPIQNQNNIFISALKESLTLLKVFSNTLITKLIP